MAFNAFSGRRAARWAAGIALAAAGMAVTLGAHRRASMGALPATLTSISEARSACRGTALPQKVKEVTAEISQVAPGVKVTKLTSDGINFVTYQDVPAYSPATNLLVLNNMTKGVFTARPDGSDAQLISGPASPEKLSPDGRFVVYAGPGAVPNKADAYGIWLDKSGPCTRVALTTSGLDLSPEGHPPNIAPPVSYGDGKEVVAIAFRYTLRRLVSDGTYLDPEPGADPPDLYQGGMFHVIRLNPKFPQWILYMRNLKPGDSLGAPENWLYNFETKQLCSVTPIGKPHVHVAWSPDGTRVGLAAGGPGTWNVATVLDSHGKALGDCSGAKYGGFDIRTVGQKFASHVAGLAADYCAWPPDDSPVFACTSPRRTGLKVYLLAMDGHGVKFLTNTDARAANDKGTPLALFAQDSQHILFRSDRDGSPQVYMVTGFTPSVP